MTLQHRYKDKRREFKSFPKSRILLQNSHIEDHWQILEFRLVKLIRDEHIPVKYEQASFIKSMDHTVNGVVL